MLEIPSQPSHGPAKRETVSDAKYPWWRSLLLLLFLLLSFVCSLRLIHAAPKGDEQVPAFVQVWMVCFLPYFAACALVLATRPTPGRWRWLELGIILVGALLLRAMLLPLPPGLSHDAWRYLWDARVTLHGYSPYVYAPDDKLLAPLRDALIYGQSRFRDVPTIYPPGAQAIYLVSYLLAPSNLFFLKGIFVVFDLVTCVALVGLLLRRGLDPRRVILYAWCPLPIVEFAIQGHVDSVTLAFMVLAILCAGSSRRGMRVMTGLLIALATLTKIYPIVLLLVVVRRRDWALLATCFGTILLGYIPYLILGQGQVFGFFASYAGEQGGNAGIVQLLTYWISHSHGYRLGATLTHEYRVDLLVVGAMSLLVFLLRLIKSISMETATILLIGCIFSISSHVFPWYTTAVLPWVVLLIGPVWTRQGGLQAKGFAVLLAWYFCCVSLTGYFIVNDWTIYYEYVYGVVLAGLGVALALSGWRKLKQLYRMTLEGKSS